ncbi:NfeD family protein [Coraliomargarita parva]|uniref:NfeD family protein n=1 Tax=Coraliomargarita parva TaxID=3014050 RepID=UPI0022B32335|nr:NfeD family protein [Coraliomargarita parva]
MTDWWTELSPELKVFYGIGILALLVVLLQMLLTLIGFDTDGVDGGFDVDVGDVDHGTGIGLFSSQTIAAFFLGFGWVGVAAVKSGLSVLYSGLLAVAFGVAAMFAMLFMLRGLLKLQSSGNLDYSKAIGSEATVYVTIPGSDVDGGGQIEVMVQGRLITASARKQSPGALKQGQRVRITAVSASNTYTVEPV